MKTKHAKGPKIKTRKVGTRKVKAKVPQYRAKKKVVKNTGNPIPKCFTMNSPQCIVATTAPDIPLPAILKSFSDTNISQSNVKRRKKKPRERHNSSEEISKDAKYPMHHSPKPNPNAEETQLSAHKDEMVCCGTLQGQTNLGSPVVVEALSENLSSLSIPEKFVQHSKSRLEEDSSSGEALYKDEKIAMEEGAAIAETVNEDGTLSKESRRNGKSQKFPTPRKVHPKRPKNSVSAETDTLPQNTSIEISKSTYAYEEYAKSTNRNNEEIDNNNLESEDGALLRQKRALRWTNDENALRLYSIRNKVIVVMQENTRFCFTGKLVLKVVYGAVEVYGSEIMPKNDRVEIYSPRGYSSVAIQTSSKSPEQMELDVWSALASEGVNRDTKNRLVDDIDQLQPGAAVIVLSNLENKLTKFLHVFYPFRLFPKIKNTSYFSWTDPRRAEIILQSNLYLGNFSCKDLIFDPCITHEVTEKILSRWRENAWSCALIAGGKSVGKSTTTRYLINNLLPACGKVVMVDVDPGQTECTPPGCISYSVIDQPLLGPNFTHLKRPVYQLYIGDVNVSRCITRYIEAIKKLIDQLTSCPVLSGLPIVVNTMGFTSGIGWDIAIFTIKLIRPSLVVQIMSERPKNNFQNVLSREVVNEQQLAWSTWSTNVVDWNQPCEHELHTIRSQAERKSTPGTEAWNMEPYQQRELVMISYLSEIAQYPENSISNYSGTSLSINEAVPYATPFSSLSISIPRACVPPSHALNVINGNIVALCGIDATTDEPEETEIHSSSPRLLTRSPLCACYGFGIVRGVDMEREEVFINTPLPASIMQHVNCLVGCIPVPVTLLQLNHFKNVPYTGGSDVLPTSREPRRGYFRMRYQNTQNNSQ